MILITKTVLRFFLFPMAAAILLLLAFIALPFILAYRVLILECAKYLRSDLISMVSGPDIVVAHDIGFWDTKPTEIIILTVTLNSHLNYQKVYEFFKGVVIEKRYQRLCQYMVPWMGFGFWKNETDFSLKNHIIEFDNLSSVVQDKKWLNDFTKKLLRNPFGKNKSPWDVHILSKYQQSPERGHKSVFIFRTHHSLLDAHSAFKLFSGVLENYMPINAESPDNPIPYSKMNYLISRMLIPLDLIKFYFENTDWNTKPWTKFVKEMSSAQVNIPIEKILLLRRKYSVEFNSIIFAGITTALRNILLRQNSSLIPKKIHLFFTVPKKNHPEHLCNHFNVTSFPVPVGASDPVERLISINDNFNINVFSRIPELYEFTTDIVGLLPFWLGHKITQLPLSGVVTIFPFGAINQIFGCSINEVHASYPVPTSQGDTGIMISGIIINGHLNLSATFDKNIVASDKMANEILEELSQHFDGL